MEILMQFAMGMILIIISMLGLFGTTIDTNTQRIVQAIVGCTGFIIISMGFSTLARYSSKDRDDR